MKENEFISPALADPMCLNRNRAYLSPEDREAARRAYVKAQREVKFTPVTCCCGMTTTVGRLAQHVRSWNHRRRVPLCSSTGGTSDCNDNTAS